MQKGKWNQISMAFRLIWNMDKMLLIDSIAASFIASVIPFIGIFLSGYILDGLQRKEKMEKLLFTAFISVAAIFFLSVCESYLKKCKEVHTDMCGKKYHSQMSMKTISMDYPLLDSPAVNDIRARIMHDNNWGAGFYSLIWELPDLLDSFLSAVLSMALLLPFLAQIKLLSDIKTILLFAVCAAVIASNVLFISLKKKQHFQLLDDPSFDKSYLSYFLWKEQDYHFGKDVRVYRVKPLIAQKLQGDLKIKNKWTYQIVRNQMQSGFYQNFSSGILQAAAWIFVVLEAVSGALTPGAVVRYAGIIYQFSQSVANVFLAMEEYAVCAKRQMSTMEYLHIPDVLKKGKLPVEKRAFCDNGDNEYEIEFCDVSFQYPGSDGYALRHISLKFQVGQRLAVVGRNGSGKTTFIKLLCRLYDPTQGEIRLNGIDIKKYDYNEYMSIFSVVFQDFKLFSFSLGQNVAASVHYDPVQVEACLKKAGLENGLTQMPDGIDTFLYKDFESDGVEISGGEAQKIALARALYKDAPFIILDEPTAALDPVAEYEVYSKFNEIVGDKTAVYISHRLSSCRFCDEILVFEQGQIVQRGSHDALIADKNGSYERLWQAQAQYYV